MTRNCCIPGGLLELAAQKVGCKKIVPFKARRRGGEARAVMAEGKKNPAW